MAQFPPFAIKRALVLGGAALIASVTWGLYAWKSSPGVPELSSADSGSAVAERGSEAARPGEPSEPLTALRATQPTPAEKMGDLGSAVRTNARASIEDAVAVQVPSTPTGRTEPPPAAAAAPSTGEPNPATAEPKQPPDPPADGHGLLKSARDAKAAGDLLAARQDYTQALRFGLPPEGANEAREELSRLSEALVFARAIVADDPLAAAHVVRPGERLALIAARERVTPEFLAELNALDNPHLLPVGARIKIVRGPFHAVIYKSDHRMDVLLGDVIVRSYRVGLGTDGGTPLGQWMVGNKLKDPDWTDPSTGRYYAADDPENPIGDRWIGLECMAGDCLGRRGFGIHGTIEPDSIGADMSMGCVRLTTEDIAAVYDLFVPKDSRIEIKP